jgi:hypothetical protein
VLASSYSPILTCDRLTDAAIAMCLVKAST